MSLYFFFFSYPVFQSRFYLRLVCVCVLSTFWVWEHVSMNSHALFIFIFCIIKYLIFDFLAAWVLLRPKYSVGEQAAMDFQSWKLFALTEKPNSANPSVLQCQREVICYMQFIDMLNDFFKRKLSLEFENLFYKKTLARRNTSNENKTTRLIRYQKFFIQRFKYEFWKQSFKTIGRSSVV